MEKIKKLSNLADLKHEELIHVEGGKNSGINVNVDFKVTWGNIRDTLRGIGDGLFGHRRKY